ncbi:MAG: Gfo/Idh/MocA family oxidoreductase [Chloroflexi bacterium]|nr:Gfo/Idh/MocA family oxidoreductase [Chloroflexota bacterium]
MTQLNALLVGAGAMGRAWAKNLHDCGDVTLASWIDIQTGQAARAPGELGLDVPHAGEDLERALVEVCPDFVVDVTVPEAHHDVTITALRAGVPVLGEKPMADSLERARAMVAASEATGKLYMVSQSRRYDPRLQAFRCLIDDHIGPAGILTADFFIGAHFGGFRDDMAHVLLLDMAIHTFDAARYLLGDSDPVAVYCEEHNPPWSWYRGAASATALFELAGGVRYTYRGSWCSEGRHTAWDSEWRAVGPRGTATWDGRSAPLADVVAARGGFHSTFDTIVADGAPGMPEGIAGSLRDFLHALKTGATPMGECHDNIKSLAMVFGAIESAETGRRVAIRW